MKCLMKAMGLAPRVIPGVHEKYEACREAEWLICHQILMMFPPGPAHMDQGHCHQARLPLSLTPAENLICRALTNGQG